jgi:hypothetical protein
VGDVDCRSQREGLGYPPPPFFIFKAKNHDSSRYHDIPKDWRIGVSDNGWTANELGLAWLQHFIKHTEARTVDSHRLLIIDGHETHKSLAFQDLCEKSKIVTLCMPPHSSHILKPLDVGCFSLLKRAYGKEIGGLATSHIDHIDKKTFLASFKEVFSGPFSKKNIQSSFQATGLVPHSPEVVLSKLEVEPRTPVLKRFNNHPSRQDEDSEIGDDGNGDSWNQLRKILDAAVADKAKVEAKRLSQSIHSLQVNNELLHHKNLGLQEALNAKKKRKKKRTTLDLQNEDTWHSGAEFYSPRKVEEGCRREATKRDEAEREQLQKKLTIEN